MPRWEESGIHYKPVRCAHYRHGTSNKLTSPLWWWEVSSVASWAGHLVADSTWKSSTFSSFNILLWFLKLNASILSLTMYRPWHRHGQGLLFTIHPCYINWLNLKVFAWKLSIPSWKDSILQSRKLIFKGFFCKLSYNKTHVSDIKLPQGLLQGFYSLKCKHLLMVECWVSLIIIWLIEKYNIVVLTYSTYQLIL